MTETGKIMRGICPECRVEQSVDADNRMSNHKDPHGTFSCEGVGKDCEMILGEKKNRSFVPKEKEDLSPDPIPEDEPPHSSELEEFHNYQVRDDSCCFDVGRSPDREMGDEDEHSPDSISSINQNQDNICCLDPYCNHGNDAKKPKRGLFGSIGEKIMAVSDLSIFNPNAKKLSQKERKARKCNS